MANEDAELLEEFATLDRPTRYVAKRYAAYELTRFVVQLSENLNALARRQGEGTAGNRLLMEAYVEARKVRDSFLARIEDESA